MKHITHESAEAFNARLVATKDGEALGFPLDDTDSVIRLNPARTTPNVAGWRIGRSTGPATHASRLALAEFMPNRAVEDWHTLPAYPFEYGNKEGWDRAIALGSEHQVRFVDGFNKLLDAAGQEWLLGFGYEAPEQSLPPGDFGDDPSLAAFYKIAPAPYGAGYGVREYIGTDLSPEGALRSAIQRLEGWE